MKKNRGIIVGPLATTFIEKKLFELVNLISTSVYADDGGGDGDEGNEPPAPSVNFEELIAKARADEKKKHYATIERLKAQIDTLTKQHNEDLIKLAGVEKELDAANKKLTTAGTGDSEEVATLKKEIKSLTTERDSLAGKVADYEAHKPASREELEAELRAEFEAEYEVKTFKATKMAELKDQILVPELVIGNTKEEVEASINAAILRSEEIKKSLGMSGSVEPPKRRTPKTPANPSMSRAQDNKYTMDYIATLDPASEEYRKYRADVGLANNY